MFLEQVMPNIVGLKQQNILFAVGVYFSWIVHTGEKPKWYAVSSDVNIPSE